MTPSELFDVIVNFDAALKKNKLPDFGNSRHAASQVLRILMVDWHNFPENEAARACDDEVRDKWEKFWDYPGVQRALESYKRRHPKR